jgi:hypothetical protein
MDITSGGRHRRSTARTNEPASTPTTVSRCAYPSYTPLVSARKSTTRSVRSMFTSGRRAWIRNRQARAYVMSRRCIRKRRRPRGGRTPARVWLGIPLGWLPSTHVDRTLSVRCVLPPVFSRVRSVSISRGPARRTRQPGTDNPRCLSRSARMRPFGATKCPATIRSAALTPSLPPCLPLSSRGWRRHGDVVDGSRPSEVLDLRHMSWSLRDRTRAGVRHAAAVSLSEDG